MEAQVTNKASLTSDPFAAGFLPLLRGNTQQKFDQLAIETFGFSAFTLMENAGRSAAFTIEREYGPMHGRKVVICSGSGNNGGDGYVVARTLYNQGAFVYVVSLKPPTTPEAKQNWSFLHQLKELDKSDRLQFDDNPHRPLPPADLYVDALLGVGLNRPLQGDVVSLVDELNATNSPVVALDLPSGLHADTGSPLGNAVRADLTITFSAYKPGLLFGQGRAYSGRIELVHIGLPLSAILDKTTSEINWISTDTAISSYLPTRDLQAHKYSAGMVLVIGGSPGLSGAPMLAARAAARVGAGYVACAVPESIQNILATTMTEIPAIRLAECPDGGIEPDDAITALQPWLAKANALVIGPGLGRHPNTQRFVQAILQSCTMPVVVDADALFTAAQLLNTSNQERNWILTPHAREFERMGSESGKLDRLDSARHWSSRWNCTLVLKGHPTIVCHGQEAAFVCGRGNPSLATAGTGDVLAGLCGGLVAQGCAAPTAAISACHIGGLTADQYSRKHHPGTMIAGDMIDGVVTALTSLRKK
ncbi:MAG: NAD(P)H-hydrate dehydratase [Bacteroidota bacterium]|nr:NAD(P)H-hydrate dehydratase [Bacteroidota bacterium]MDE2646483.1 NAD(P)H-hydrate dehydratase [Bacteroidota bacterium]